MTNEPAAAAKESELAECPQFTASRSLQLFQVAALQTALRNKEASSLTAV